MLRFIKRFFIGMPLNTERAKHELLNKFLALPVFASDALSSVAYATEEILLVLVLTGAAFLYLSIPISIAISVLLIIVAISYTQTVKAYPSGGGAYVVAKDNLGIIPAQVAASSLLIDYILTVSVSISAGVAAIVSAFPSLHEYKVLLCLFMLLFVTIINLRGVKESAKLIAFPVYIFIFSIIVMISMGLFRFFKGAALPIADHQVITAVYPIGIFLILRAFASGCAALTGIEAISNGIQAFKEPKSKNAAVTLAWMAFLLGFMFLGITFLTSRFHIVPIHGETVVSQLARIVLGGQTWFYYLIQILTAFILLLAANTSFAGFPRLSAIEAQDRFLPKQLTHIGDRLVFSNGMLLLSFISGLLIIIFKGSTHHLIPLYAVGVFLSFTLSQAGMVVHWYKLKSPRWQINMFINALGAMATSVTVAVVAIAKFTQGAWIVVFLIPLFSIMFLRINKHYLEVDRYLSLEGIIPLPHPKHTVILLVSSIHRGIIPAIKYTKSISADVRALHIEAIESQTEKLKKEWEQWGEGIPLVILESPYRSFIDPCMKYLDEVEKERKGCLITVVIPEFVVDNWWHKLLHNQTGLMLKIALLFRKNIIISNVRYHLRSSKMGIFSESIDAK